MTYLPKVAILAESLNTHYAGIYTYAKELSTELARDSRGLDFTFIVHELVPFLPREQQLVLPKGMNFPGSSSMRTFLKMPSKLSKNNFDLVHDLFHIAPFVGKTAPYKRVITIHDMTPIKFPKFHVWRGPLVHKLVLPHIIEGADSIIAVSKSTKKDILEYYPSAKNISVIPLAGKSLPEPTGTEVDFPYILCVATLEPRKNIETLITAFEKIAGSIPHHLVLVGHVGWKSKSLKLMLRNSEFAHRIHHVGYTDEQALSNYFTGADLFVYPSQYEGFGMPVIEAMNFGIPVILASNSSLLEVGKDAGVFFSTFDSNDLAEKMKEIIVDREKWEKVGKVGKEKAKEYSWKRTADMTCEVYMKLLGEK